MAKQPHEGVDKHTLAFAFLFLFIGNIFANSFSLGYGFSDMRNVNNQTLLGLGPTPKPTTILCANGISFAPAMAVSGAILPSNYLDYKYNSSLTPYAACFSNYTCALTYIDGTPYKTVSNSDPYSIFTTMSNITTAMTYKAQCFVYDKVGGNASSTEQRLISFSVEIVIPPFPSDLNTTEYTNETTVILYGKATIPSFMSSSGSSSTDLGNFVGFVLILIGIYGLIFYSRVFTEWH